MFTSEGIVKPKFGSAYGGCRPSPGQLGEIQEFLKGFCERASTDRVLSTVPFTGIVGSTDLAARVDDARWLELREAHDELVRRNLSAFRGHEVQTTGDVMESASRTGPAPAGPVTTIPRTRWGPDPPGSRVDPRRRTGRRWGCNTGPGRRTGPRPRRSPGR